LHPLSGTSLDVDHAYIPTMDFHPIDHQRAPPPVTRPSKLAADGASRVGTAKQETMCALWASMVELEVPAEIQAMMRAHHLSPIFLAGRLFPVL
jgi:hypothetical protein